MSFGLFDKAIHLTEPEASTLAGLFGCEEWLECVLDHFLAHTDPAIGHRDQHVLAAPYLGVGSAIILIEKSVAGLDCQRAAVRQGITCVDRKIEQRRVEFVRIDFDPPQPGAADRLHVDGLAERALQELDLSGDELVEIEWLRVEGLPPRERQQPSGQGRSAFRTAQRILRSVPQSAGGATRECI
jgi:hypothetical protein